MLNNCLINLLILMRDLSIFKIFMFYKVGLKYLSVNFFERNKYKIYIIWVKMVIIWEDGVIIIGR